MFDRGGAEGRGWEYPGDRGGRGGGRSVYHPLDPRPDPRSHQKKKKETKQGLS